MAAAQAAAVRRKQEATEDNKSVRGPSPLKALYYPLFHSILLNRNSKPRFRGLPRRRAADKAMRGARMHIVRSEDSTTIRYFRRGHGPAILLIHGTAADHSRSRTASTLRPA